MAGRRCEADRSPNRSPAGAAQRNPPMEDAGGDSEGVGGLGEKKNPMCAARDVVCWAVEPAAAAAVDPLGRVLTRCAACRPGHKKGGRLLWVHLLRSGTKRRPSLGVPVVSTTEHRASILVAAIYIRLMLWFWGLFAAKQETCKVILSHSPVTANGGPSADLQRSAYWSLAVCGMNCLALLPEKGGPWGCCEEPNGLTS